MIHPADPGQGQGGDDIGFRQKGEDDLRLLPFDLPADEADRLPKIPGQADHPGGLAGAVDGKIGADEADLFFQGVEGGVGHQHQEGDVIGAAQVVCQDGCHPLRAAAVHPGQHEQYFFLLHASPLRHFRSTF